MRCKASRPPGGFSVLHRDLVARVGRLSTRLQSWEHTATRAVRAAAAQGPEPMAIPRIAVPQAGSESHACGAQRTTRV